MRQFYEITSPTEILFDKKVELLPSVTEVFELELAFLEYQTLSDDEFLIRSAYAKKYKEKFTLHYLMYSELPEDVNKNRTTRANNYFKNGIYSTGYATHSLFPYRGKFHPQLIKALINIIGLKKGDIILDPMAGSGTTNIEASLLGINSYAIDINPFCQFMIKTKYNALKLDLKILDNVNLDSNQLYNFFNKKENLEKLEITENNKKIIYELALLAYLDALGYSKRVKRSSHPELFTKVLQRYIATVRNMLSNKFFDNKNLGTVKIIDDAEAFNTELPDNSVDGIITSPPYSFAIDYVENDKAQLEYLGYNPTKLKEKFIGLKGKTKADKLSNYFEDMNKFLNEASRVLKKNKFIIIIIGSNTNQTGGIRLENKIIDIAKEYKLNLVKSIIKPIKGMRNTMKEEYILFFEKK